MAWQYSTTFSTGNGITLPPTCLLRAGDVVRLVVLHGNEQTLDFIAGVDFQIVPPDRLTWTDLPVRSGDTVVVFNYGSTAPFPKDDELAGNCSDNLLAKGQAWLARMKQRHESCPVVYQRGSQFVELRATIGKTVFENENGAGGIVRFESRDFLVPPSKLVLNSAVTEPERGDLVREIDGRVYEVLSDGSEPCFRYSDPYRNLLRIHTKKVR